MTRRSVIRKMLIGATTVLAVLLLAGSAAADPADVTDPLDPPVCTMEWPSTCSFVQCGVHQNTARSVAWCEAAGVRAEARAAYCPSFVVCHDHPVTSCYVQWPGIPVHCTMPR